MCIMFTLYNYLSFLSKIIFYNTRAGRTKWYLSDNLGERENMNDCCDPIYANKSWVTGKL